MNTIEKQLKYMNKRRHATKPWKWIRNKYFSASEELCTFASVELITNKQVKIFKLYRAGKVPIIRHTKIKSSANPFVREDDKYFNKRRKDLKYKSNKTKQKCIIWKEKKDIDKTLLNLWKQKSRIVKKITIFEMLEP